MSDSYLTISQPSEGLYKDRGSKFLAYAFPIDTEQDVPVRLDEIRRIHPKARHYCYAYRLGVDGLVFRANDDGEPSGTAGRPILGQLDSLKLTHTLVIVVRYFGGTLLGTSGLIQAYRAAAADALSHAAIIARHQTETIELTFGYEIMGEVMDAVKRLQVEILSQQFDDGGKIHLAIPRSQVKERLTMLMAMVAKISLEEARERQTIPGLSVRVC